ncbi:hypothetical protein CXG81DRAFT_24858 [Caulochytrium protostelioides]|uniref:Exocyst complex component EXO84 n=1 Tax=Caulochytrium protostelioides TaxID=1555241 RepID=A0A4P9XAW6_9FUNG|nr:hypothetical protein CXG81DRAFT_24858 [Caulochytrium protostelioides]|eukprot:RKP02485.1 hypothetical protein CXG81DRAFT_24858 [Caulochytrium protostelioides]
MAPSLASLALFGDEDFNVESHIRGVLLQSTEPELRAYTSALQQAKDVRAGDLQRNVYNNYEEFVVISREIARLERDMLRLKDDFGELRSVNEALLATDVLGTTGLTGDPGLRSGRPHRAAAAGSGPAAGTASTGAGAGAGAGWSSAAADATASRAGGAGGDAADAMSPGGPDEIQEARRGAVKLLYQQVEGLAKTLPETKTRFIVKDGTQRELHEYASESTTGKRTSQPVSYILFNDALVMVIKKRGIMGGVGKSRRMVLDKAWKLRDIAIVDVKNADDVVNAFKIMKYPDVFIYGCDHLDDKRTLLITTKRLADDVMAQRKLDLERQQREMALAGPRRRTTRRPPADASGAPLSAGGSGADRLQGPTIVHRANELGFNETVWLHEVPSELGLLVVHRHFDEAIEVVYRVRRLLEKATWVRLVDVETTAPPAPRGDGGRGTDAAGAGPSSFMQQEHQAVEAAGAAATQQEMQSHLDPRYRPIAVQIALRVNKLAEILLAELTSPVATKHQVMTNIRRLIALDMTNVARKTFLESRSEVLSHHIRQLRHHTGQLRAFVAELCETVFLGIAESADCYHACFLRGRARPKRPYGHAVRWGGKTLLEGGGEGALSPLSPSDSKPTSATPDHEAAQQHQHQQLVAQQHASTLLAALVDTELGSALVMWIQDQLLVFADVFRRHVFKAQHGFNETMDAYLLCLAIARQELRPMGVDLVWRVAQLFQPDLQEMLQTHGQWVTERLKKALSSEKFLPAPASLTRSQATLDDPLLAMAPTQCSPCVYVLVSMLRRFMDEPEGWALDPSQASDLSAQRDVMARIQEQQVRDMNVFGTVTQIVCDMIDGFSRGLLQIFSQQGEWSYSQMAVALIDAQFVSTQVIQAVAEHLERRYRRPPSIVFTRAAEECATCCLTLKTLFVRLVSDRLFQREYHFKAIDYSQSAALLDRQKPSDPILRLLRELNHVARDLSVHPMLDHIGICTEILEKGFEGMLAPRAWESTSAGLLSSDTASGHPSPRRFGYGGVQQLVLDIHFFLRVADGFISDVVHDRANAVCEQALKLYFQNSLVASPLRDGRWYDERVEACAASMASVYPALAAASAAAEAAAAETAATAPDPGAPAPRSTDDIAESAEASSTRLSATLTGRPSAANMGPPVPEEPTEPAGSSEPLS